MLKNTFVKSLSIGTIGFVLAGLPGIILSQDTAPVGFADQAVCMPGLINVPEALRTAPSGNAEDLPTEIEADEFETAGELVNLIGNAQVVQGNRGVYADRIEYDQESYKAAASGNVKFYTSNGDEITADSMNLEVDTFIGEAKQVGIKIVDTNPSFSHRNHQNYTEDYSVFAPFRNRVTVTEEEESEEVEAKDKKYYQRARATGESMEFEGNDYEVLHDAVMTTCPDGNNDVQLAAKRLELDHATGIGTAKSMTVRLKNVPIMYFPTISFPINDERKTGFLFPSIGDDDESGTILSIPYYINIQNNVDATVTPRILTERGIQVYSELRYLTENSDGSVRFEVLPSDRVFNDEDRYAFSFDHNQEFGNNWRASIDLEDVSDAEYLRDFTNSVDIVASSFVPQRASLTHSNDLISFQANVQKYEVVNSALPQSSLPFDILPRLNLSLVQQELGLLKFGVKGEFVQFDHEDSARFTGSRTSVVPHISLPIEEVFGYIEPKISLHNISYSLDTPAGNASPTSPSAAIPVYSIDGSLVFERPLQSGAYYQTLEPRLFYVNIPTEADQNDFPIFDTGESVPSSFGHFFRENRFFGGDRVGDTEQLTLGLTTRILDDADGSEKLKLSIGEVIFLKDREIRLTPDQPPLTETESDFIAELTASINADWNASGFMSIDNATNDLEVLRLSTNYYHSPRRNASFAYTEVNNGLEQLSIDFDVPLSPHWQLGANASYSLQDDELRSSAINLSYDGCCWAVRIGTQRFLDGRGEFNNRFLITLELDDLGRIGSSF